MTKPSDVIAKLNELKKKYYECGKDLVPHTMQLLVQDPIESYFFTAYTPYFSDGDECIYGIGDIYFKINKSSSQLALGIKVIIKAFDSYGTVTEINGNMVSINLNNGKSILVPASEVTIHDQSDKKGYESSYNLKGDVRKKADDIEKFIQGVPNDILKEVLGDHVRITVSRSGIETAPYDHQ